MAPTFNDVYQDDAPRCDQHKYSGLLGMLIYVLRTRPDISYPGQSTWNEIQQIN